MPLRLTELNTVASLVSMLAPLLVGIFATSFLGWRFGLILAILALLIMGIIYRKLNFNTFPLPQKAVNKQGQLPLRYWTYWFGVFFVVAIEFCFIFWGSDYFIEVTNAKTEIASAAISLFLGAMLLGRWSGSRILRTTKPSTVLFISLALAMIGFFLFWSTSLIWIALMWFFPGRIWGRKFIPYFIGSCDIQCACFTIIHSKCPKCSGFCQRNLIVTFNPWEPGRPNRDAHSLHDCSDHNIGCLLSEHVSGKKTKPG